MWCTSVLSVVMSIAQFGPAPDAHDALYYKLNAANVSDVCAAFSVRTCDSDRVHSYETQL